MWSGRRITNASHGESQISTDRYLFLLPLPSSHSTNTQQTPLHFCASKTNLSAARKLLAPPYKASSRLPDKQQQLPIHRAAAVGSVPMLKLLLDHNSPLNSVDRSGLTPLHHAVAEGHGDVAVELLKRGAESDRKDHDGNVPLKLAPDAKVSGLIAG